jgi:hypothetical protein
MTAELTLVIRNASALESLGNDKDMPPTSICFRRVGWTLTLTIDRVPPPALMPWCLPYGHVLHASDTDGFLSLMGHNLVRLADQQGGDLITRLLDGRSETQDRVSESGWGAIPASLVSKPKRVSP